MPAASASSARVPIEPFGLDRELREVLSEQGITELYPPQGAALPAVLAGRNLLLACPTASGKSLVAYLALLRAVRAGRTGLYMVPLRALGQEKYEELEAFARLGLKVGLSVGDFDISSEKLDKLDVLVATSEKADGLLRRGSPWLDRLGCVVVDEIHLLRDPERGPTLEVSITRLKRRHAELQIVALSATIGNAAELASWLAADLIESEFRPVPLKMGVYHDGSILFTDLTTRPIEPPGEPVARLVRTVVQEGGQALVFTSTRRGSEQAAELLAKTMDRLLSPSERASAEEVAASLASLAEEATEGARKLSALLPRGVAFHNASLTTSERRLVERAFKERQLKALAATPTLAAGVNLPARRVIVRDTTRYDDRIGMNAPIPAGEVHQMLGRAGRPRFDSSGEAVILAKSLDEQERFLDRYLTAPPEEVVSRLAAEPAMRMHLLALVASHEVTNASELERFFAETFYGRTLPLEQLTHTVESVQTYLVEHEFLAPSTELRATPFGRLTSDLYLDPLSAQLLREALERTPHGVRPFPLLAAIAATPDLPPFYLRRGELPGLMDRLAEEREELLLPAGGEDGNAESLELFLASLKTAIALERWVDETPILSIAEGMGVGAGDLHAKVEDAEWLLFGMSRLAAHFRPFAARAVDALALRVRYGVREELLDLVRLRGIGRVRARILFGAGYRDRESLRAAPESRIGALLNSPALAESVLRQLRPPRAGARAEPPAAEPARSPARRTARGQHALDQYSDPE